MLHLLTLGGLWQYSRDETAVNVTNENITNFSGNFVLFKFKYKITGKTKRNGKKNVNIMVPLKCLSNFLRTLEMPLIKYKINLILNWSKSCVISDENQATAFAKRIQNVMFQS